MKIDDLAKDIEKTWFSDEFLVLLESHIPLLRTSNKTRVVDVNARQAEKYNGDFYGLLDELNIEKKYHMAVTRFNGFDSSNDYTGEMLRIYIPDLDYIQKLKMLQESVSV